MSLHSSPCIGGQITDTLQHNQLVLHYSPPDCLPEMDLSNVSDPLLLDYLCDGRTVFPCPCNDNDTFMVECLTSLRKVVSPYPFKQEYLIARLFDVEDTTPLTVLHMALVRDCLIGAGCERLKDACTRPRWTVAREEYYAGHYVPTPGECGTAPAWKLQAGGPAGQTELAGLVQYITERRRCALPRPAVILHPWQTDPLFRRRLPLTFHIISPGAYLRRRDGKLYNATGGSGFQSTAVRLSDWMQRITTCFSQHVAVKRRTGPQLSTF